MNQQHPDSAPLETAGEATVIGDGTPNRALVSIQLLQNIYNELTGKTEELSKSFDDPFQIEIEDINQLNIRFLQTLEQYSICTHNCSVKVYYTNDTDDTFSSFERFVSFTSGGTSSIESILITYNFLVILPKIRTPQPYTISIRLASRISIEKRFHNEFPHDVPKIFKLMGTKTAMVTVKYIDYVVARTMLNCVEEWMKTTKKAETNRLIKFLKRHSSQFQIISKYTVGLCAFWVLWLYIPSLVKPESNPVHMAQFFVGSFVGLFAAYKLAFHLGRSAEDAIDSYSEPSFLSITSGDRIEIGRAQKRNRLAVFGTIANFVLTLGTSIAVKLIVELILKAMRKA